MNAGYPVDIVPLVPRGTNSTFFTECCSTAICDYEWKCPKCKRLVVGWDASTTADRQKVRWKNATRFWTKGGVNG